MATNTSSQVIAAQSGPWAQVRTGTVSTANESSASIIVGGTSFLASFISPYQPEPGELVAVIRQDSSWIILGRIAGSGANLIVNGSFEDTPDGTFPDPWVLYEISGLTSVAVVSSADAVDGNNVVQIANDAGVSDSFLYSSPVAVTLGDVMSLSVYAGAVLGPGDYSNVNASLYALWFANTTNLYPTTSSADSLIDSATAVAVLPPFTPLSGNVTAPVTGFMRLALRSVVTDPTMIDWDFAIVRRAA
jgi:hypothetical protein